LEQVERKERSIEGSAKGDVRMESQGSRAHSAGVAGELQQVPSRTCASRGRPLARWLLWAGLLCLGVAQATSYVYDANGRVVAVTQSTGVSAQYTYDALGNLVQIGTVSAGQLALFAFTPSHGTAGTTVTIDGQGFSSAAANNSVSFNGIAATVLSTSTTQLIVSAPNGATTAPISVSVGVQTATSATPFVIDDTGVPPTISQVTPTVATIGSTITVTGAHLGPVAGGTTVQMGRRDVAPTSVADAQLQYVVPMDGASGYVTVSTPFGTTTSATPIVVLPSSISASSVVSSGYAMANGAGVTLNIGGAGQIGAIVFDASQSPWISLQASHIATAASSISYTIYGPGNVVIQQGTISTSSPSIHLPRLMNRSTYLATFQPNSAGAQLTVNVETNATLTTNAALDVSTSVPGQSKRLVFKATEGQNLEFTLNGVSITGTTSSPVSMSMYDASGIKIVTANNCLNTWICRYPIWNTEGGEYTVIVVPPDASSTIGFNALLLPDTQGPILSANNPVTINLGIGQVERYTFAAEQGSNVALKLSNVNTGNVTWPVNVNVYGPSGSAITTSNYYVAFNALGTNGTKTINLSNLPASGTYTLVIYTSGVPGTAQLTFSTSPVNAIAVNGTNQTDSASLSGQNIYLSFTANQADNLELTINSVSIVGTSSGTVAVNVYNANGANISSANNCSNTWTCRYPLWNLAAGTYTVVISPPDVTSTISAAAMLEPDIQGGALSANTPISINLGMGQVERYTFAAAQGSNVALRLASVNTGNVNWPVNVNVYSPSTGTITTGNYYTTFNAPGTNGAKTINLSNLPTSGTYTLVIYTSGLPGTAQLTFSPSPTNPITDNGTNQTDSASLSGQNIYLSFTANQADNLELTINNVSIVGTSSGTVAVNVYDANGTNLSSANNCSNTWTCRYPLWNLVTGTYTIVISPPDITSTISAAAMLEPDIQGGALSANIPISINLGMGQVERYTFAAAQGSNVALQLSSVNTGNVNWPMNVNVYSPSTGTITAGDYYTTFNAPGTNGAKTINLSSLPASGTYTLVVYTSGVSGSAQLTLVPQ
jgi:YD repeat-containing protein